MDVTIVQKGVHTSEGPNKGLFWLRVSTEVEGFQMVGFLRTTTERKEKVAEKLTLPAAVAKGIQWQS